MQLVTTLTVLTITTTTAAPLPPAASASASEGSDTFLGPCGPKGILGFYKGAENAAVCCDVSCGTCASDRECGRRPGGKDACCPGVIRRQARECGTKEPACPIRKKCRDWKPLARWKAPYPSPRPLHSGDDEASFHGGFRVLLVIPVGRKKADAVADTCIKAFALNLTVFLAHYDGSQSWYADTYSTTRSSSSHHLNQFQRGGGGWYQKVWRSVNYTDFKANYVRKEIVGDAQLAQLIVREFSHVWVVDDDVRFPSVTRVARFLDTVRKLDPLIAQPAIRGSWQALVTPEQRRKLGGCHVWTTDFVEVMGPIIKSVVLVDVYSRLLSKSSRSDWGMDMVWCRYAALRYRHENPACLVIDTGGTSAEESFRKADRISARPNYFKFYQHSYSTQASLWDKRCMKHNLRPLWTTFQAKCLQRSSSTGNAINVVAGHGRTDEASASVAWQESF